MNKKGIYRFKWDMNNCFLGGIFISTEKEIKSIIGKNIYFGEVDGKHSEVEGTIEENEIVLITEDEEAIKIFEKYQFKTGYDPFEYMEEIDNV